MLIARHRSGIIIHGVYPSDDVQRAIKNFLGPERFGLVIADPPYGNIVTDDWDDITVSDDTFVDQMLLWVNVASEYLMPNSGIFMWGGIGIPHYRPLYKFLARIEQDNKFVISNHITWAKKRAYGIQHNYLFTREELIYLFFGQDHKHPRVFNIPLLDELRGYAGYNPKYPAKSEFKRRTNVWTDITEIFRGKIHTAQKPIKLHEILIEAHSLPDEIIFDPFAGSGTTGAAAMEHDRRFVLVEANKESFDLIVDRLGATPYNEP